MKMFLYLKKIILLNICILYCLRLNTILFLTLFISILFRTLAVLNALGLFWTQLYDYWM